MTVNLSPGTERAAAALKSLQPSEDEMGHMLQFLCGYCPDGVQDAVESVTRLRDIMAGKLGSTAGVGRPAGLGLVNPTKPPPSQGGDPLR
jgi:hypothetical protein